VLAVNPLCPQDFHCLCTSSWAYWGAQPICFPSCSLVPFRRFTTKDAKGAKGATREDLDFLRVTSCPLWFVDLPPRTQRCNERRSGFPSCSFVPFVVVDLPPKTQTYTKRDRELFYAQQNAASACEAAPFRHQPKRKSANLIKDLVEVLATNAKTLRGSLSPNETPWPGLISGFTCFLFDAGRATRDSDKTPG